MSNSKQNDPAYSFADFKRACRRDQRNVFVYGSALKNAGFFNLRTKSQLLDFISNDGLEGLSFINKKEWENNPNKENPIMVDAYEFQTRSKLGYIALMYNKKTRKWIIKSFKPSEHANQIMRFAFEKVRLLGQEKDDG